MPDHQPSNLLQADLLQESETSLPVGQLIFQAASAIADAQLAMDQAALFSSQMMSGKVLDEDGREHNTKVPLAITLENGKRTAQYFSMFELGFVPSFYQFVSNELELKVSMRLRDSKESLAQIESIPLDAAYINRYNFNMRGASTLRVKVSPTPPPLALEQMQAMREYGECRYCLNAEVSVLKGLGSSWQQKLSALGITTLAQLAGMDQAASASLTAQQQSRIREFANQAKTVCYPAVFVPTAPLEPVLAQRNMAQLIADATPFTGLLPTALPKLQLEKYLLMLEMCLDKSVLEQVSVSEFFV